jgi:hypothetical protein
MYKIDKTAYGFKLIFGGVMEVPELRAWLRASAEILKPVKILFSVLVDMRTLIPLDDGGKAVMNDGQQLYRTAGMERSVVILENPVTLMQFKRIAHTSGIYRWERYISVVETPNWEQVALDWLEQGIDPDRIVSAVPQQLHR